jgi:hypothetical protein
MKTPWHIWTVGILSLLWNAFGAFDYLMAQTRNASYVEMVPEEFRAQFLAYLDGMPIWAASSWALGVWASILGSFLILARSRHAVTAFVASIVGLAVNSAYTYLIAQTNLSMMTGTSAQLFTALILAVLLLLTWYAVRQRALGRLR